MQEEKVFVNRGLQDMTLYDNILSAAYFLAPVWIVNISLVFCGYFRRNGWLPDWPIDRGKVFFDGKRFTGESVTFYGLALSIIFGLLVGEAQRRFYAGFLLGLGGWFGNAMGSFIKRRIGLAQGAFVPLLDHIDYVAGAFLFYCASREPISRPIIIYGIVLTLLFHPIVCFLGFKAGFKEKPW